MNAQYAYPVSCCSSHANDVTSPAPEAKQPNLTLVRRASAKRHAIKVSMETRSGKFTRVSEEFCKTIETQLEAKLIELKRVCTGRNGQPVTLDGDNKFLTPRAKRLIAEAFEQWVAEEIHRQTKNVVTGKTF